MKKVPTTDINLFGLYHGSDLPKDLPKSVHPLAPAFTHLHSAASDKNPLNAYLTGISCTYRWDKTIYIGRKMLKQSCNDDAGLGFTHPLILLVVSHLAFGFAQTFARLAKNPAKHISYL